MAFSNSKSEFRPGICNTRPQNYSSVPSARGSPYNSGQIRLPAQKNGGRESYVPKSPLLSSPEESQSPFPPSPFSPYPSPLPPSGHNSSLISDISEDQNVQSTVDLSQLLQQNTGSSLSGIDSRARNASGSESQTIPTEPKKLQSKRHINSEKGKHAKRQKKQQVKTEVTSLDEVSIPEHTLQQKMSRIIHDEAIETSPDTVVNNYPNPFIGEGFGFNDDDISQVDSDNLARLLAYFLLNYLSSTIQNVASNQILTAPIDFVNNILIFLNQIQPSWNSAFAADDPNRLQANAMWRPMRASLNLPDSHGMGLPPQDNSYPDVPTMVPAGTTSETRPFPPATALTNNHPSGRILPLPTKMFNPTIANNSAVAAFSEPGPSRVPMLPNDIPSVAITPPQTSFRQRSTGQSMGPPEHHSIDVVKGEPPYVHTLWQINYTDWTKILDLWKHDIDPENQNSKRANIGLNQLIKTIFSYNELLKSTLSGRKGANEMPALNSEKLLILYAYVAYIKNNPNNTFPENAISIERKLSTAGIKYVKHWVSQLCHETKTRHNRQ